MTRDEQAARDLIVDMRQMLLTMHEASSEKDREIAALKQDLQNFQTQMVDASLAQFVDEGRQWLDAYRAAVQPAATEQQAS
ncbi:MAG: hypothetical protein CTY36_00445 [Methylocystis sp.]|nr:MAG: hypothetical protein CTY36_00445 [Methylocystis sp.]